MTAPTWLRPPQDPRDYAERLRAVGLAASAAGLVALCRRSVRLVAADHISEAASTRLGGRPVLAPDAAWPATPSRRPLSLIAQVDCADVARLLPDCMLPARGLLSFFFDALEQPWGFDPRDRTGWAVRHTIDDRAALRDFPGGLASQVRFAPVPLHPRVE